jgi:lactose/L-arabinose transport system substrate-binding protein
MLCAPTTKQWIMLSLLCLSALLIAACAAPTPAAIEVTKVVQSTVVVPATVQVEVTKVVAGTPVVQQVVVTATPPPQPTAAPKPKGKITVWGWQSTYDTIVRTGVMDAFKKEYPDIQVEYTQFRPQDVYQKIPVALSAGAGGPDVAVIESSHMLQYIELGGLLDLTDRVKPYVNVMNKYKWYDAAKNGKYYGMPWDSGPVVLYYRRDVLKNAGLKDDPESVGKMVATWDDYLATCKTIKDKTGCFCFSNNKSQNTARLYEMMLWQQGLGYYNAKGDITVDSPENVATLEKMGEFWKANVTSDELEWSDTWYAELGRMDKPIATIVEASWMGVFLKTDVSPKTAGNWGVTSMPAMKAGQPRAANDGGSNMVILEQSKNKDAAWAFVEFVLGRRDSQLKMFAFSDFIPSLETTYDDALFIEPDSYFGGQVARKVYAEVVKIIPQAYIYGPFYSQMNTFVSTAIQKYAMGQATAANALKEAATSIRAQAK